MKTILPIGNRILCKRKKVGDKLGSGIIVAADMTADRSTDLAVVTYVPEQSFADIQLIQRAEVIINSLVDKASAGDSAALKGLLEFNYFLKMKSLKVGDEIFLSKYVGTDFHDNNSPDMMTITNIDDIIGIVRQS